ncbi:unnamed protein product [Phytophthora fragariaefolia]|uniref:Unnamed protein product n=1 Tax=Phytophthora fragariaefolia TaxID=1490495 RepID=A0A9W6TQ80_9STRA|nr:unnamed protein product [Phytophthora fragariaefolia]
MGFKMFYPTADFTICFTPSLESYIIHLCKQDSVMTEIFKYLPSHGLLKYDNPHEEEYTKTAEGKDIFEIKTVMITLLRRSSAEAITNLNNETFNDFIHEPNCFLRLLHVLQTHYFSIVHQLASHTSNRLVSSPGTSSAFQHFVGSFLEYVDALMIESLAVLKRLHKASRQHEEIITWRLNGSFFHILLPSALECLSILLETEQDDNHVDNILLVEQILPNLHVMLQMMDEVSWKMHSVGDGGNQTHDGCICAPSSHLNEANYENNWFSELGDACAVLCGKLSCELLYPSNVKLKKSAELGAFCTTVLAEGNFLAKGKTEISLTSELNATSISNILEWERLGVFEVEDELVDSNVDSTVSGLAAAISSAGFENHRFLVQFSDTIFLDETISFWDWVTTTVSHETKFTFNIQRLLTISVGVAAWHLGLADELRQVYELYNAKATLLHNGTDSFSPTSNIWKYFTALVCAVNNSAWLCTHSDSKAIANAAELSCLLLSLQPNPVLMGCMQHYIDIEPSTEHQSWCSMDDSFDKLFRFLTTMDAKQINHFFVVKNVHTALARTGICILHDLLRKLTTSSAKSGLLNEFVNVACDSNYQKSRRFISTSVTMNKGCNKLVDKAIENLFVRLARIISSNETSFELKKKALLAWAVPLGTSKESATNAVVLIAKAGIVSTLVELLLDEASVFETHAEMNANVQPECCVGTATDSDKSGSRKPVNELKGNPINTLLFDFTTDQIISALAWEALGAITWQLRKSEQFACHSSKLFLQLAGSSLQDRDLSTPRNASMSPRRRLTLPKKMVMSTVDEVFEQLIDGLYLMLKKVKGRFESIEDFSKEYEGILRSASQTSDSNEGCVKNRKYGAQVFMLGRPIQISLSSTHDAKIPINDQFGSSHVSMLGFTLSFWIYVEYSDVLVTKQSAGSTIDGNLSLSSQPQKSFVRLLALSSDQERNSGVDQAGSSLVVYVSDWYPDHILLGISLRWTESASENCSSIRIDEHLSRRHWIHMALSFDKDGPERLRVLVGGKRSTLNNGKGSLDSDTFDYSEFAKKAASWSVLTAGGTADIHARENNQGTGDPGASTSNLMRLSFLPNRFDHAGFSAILDDVMLTQGPIDDGMAIRLQNNGSVLFRLKQQHIVEKHCVQVLHILCLLAGGIEHDSSQASLTQTSFSDRWIILFYHMLESTCRGHDLAQVCFCYLLQNILPQVPPFPEFDIKSLGENLFCIRSSNVESTNVEEIFKTFNEKNHFSSTSAVRHIEAVHRLMQQRGMFHRPHQNKCLPFSSSSSTANPTETQSLRANISMRFAAAVDLFQKLWSTASWKARMNEFNEISCKAFLGSATLKEIVQSKDKSTVIFSDMHTLICTFAGYSEDTLNLHRTSTQDAIGFPSFLSSCQPSFSSILYLENDSIDHATSIQNVTIAMLKEETRQALYLPSRKDLLAKYHNDVSVVDAIDRRISSIVHLRARILRVLLGALRSELYESIQTKVWHHFLLKNSIACEALLEVASSCTKECVVMMLGPDAKVAMKLRQLRLFSREVLRGGSHRRTVLSTVPITDLEILEWRIWEEMSTYPIGFDPWWQQKDDTNGKLVMEVVGGEVEMSDLKVTALEHFPTVKLSQANICANSGLWFFEVTVLTDGLMQIGYVDGDFTADPLQGQGVGDHTNSWAFDGFRCKKWSVSSYDYGEPWKADDVVGILLDTDRMEISYFLNGKFLGVAFSAIPIATNSRMCPAASLNVHQSAQFNFGSLNTESVCGDSLQASTTYGFKHSLALENKDHARLKPIVYAIQSHTSMKSGEMPNTGSHSIDEPKANAIESDWSSSSDSGSDDGDISLECLGGLPGRAGSLESETRDSRETGSTADISDDGNCQRRRDLVEGLTGLGFPLEWASRCATETRLPMDETGAVGWILEQMGKVGLDGVSTLPSVSASTDECPHQPTAFWSTQVINNSRDGTVAEAASISSGASPTDKINGGDTMLNSGKSDNQLPSIPVICPSASLPVKQMTTLAESNAFIEAENDDQYSHDVSREAFQVGTYIERQKLHDAFQLLWRTDTESASDETPALNSTRGIDGLLPLSMAVDTTLFIAYARQAFTSLLLLALHKKERHAVYATLKRLVSTKVSSCKLYRVLRIAIGLELAEATVELGLDATNCSLQLQKAIIALLQFEARTASEKAPELPPLINSLFQEILSQCERGLSLAKNKSNTKHVTDPMRTQPTAAWFAWVSGLVLSFVEAQTLETFTSDPKPGSATSEFYLHAFGTMGLVPNLISIACGSSSAWKYVAFRLISRILSVVKAHESNTLSLSQNEQKQTEAPSNVMSDLYDSAQFEKLVELFTLRLRREKFGRVFFSDLTNCLFTLLVRLTFSFGFIPKLNKTQLSAKSSMSLVVSHYSSCQATISWEYATSPGTSSTDLISDSTMDARSESNTKVLLLDVKRHCQNSGGYQLCPGVSLTKALPSKGAYTIRNLLPDTTYCIRVCPAQPMDETANTLTVEDIHVPQVTATDGAEIIVQTQPEPVFDLDNDSVGKNLLVFNRNMSAKNTVNKKWHSVRASVAFDEGIHQWQVRLDSCVSKNIFIGVCTAEASMENYIGSDTYGYGFLANKAIWHNKAKLHSYGEIFKQGDIIQVTLDCNAKTLAFSRNGEYLGIAASNMRAGFGRAGGSSSEVNCKWYPAFSMYNKDDKLTLIPPPAASVFISKDDRPQNASTFDIIEAMHDVLAYHNHVTGIKLDSLAIAKLYEKAYNDFEGWRQQKLIFREISLGQLIKIDKSLLATEKYGLMAGDAVFTSKGQCTVLGEYRHELWYEVDEGCSSSLFGASTTQLASWSLGACCDMLSSPDEYPIHRHPNYKRDLGSNSTTDCNVAVQQNLTSNSSEVEVFSFEAFVEAQERWNDGGIHAAELDAKLITNLDYIASSQGSSPLHLSFSDITTALLLEKIYEAHDIFGQREVRQIIARIGLLLYVNRCLYNTVRLAMPRNIHAMSLRTPIYSDSLRTPSDFREQPATAPNTECCQVSPVAALLNSSYWGLGDSSDFTFISAIAPRLLFASQKEKLVEEELRTTKTKSNVAESLNVTKDSDEAGVDNDLSRVKITYPLNVPTPFWEQSSRAKASPSFRLPAIHEKSIFLQLADQLAAQNASQWRQEFSQPFEAIPISQAFQVQIETTSLGAPNEPSNNTEFEKNSQQEPDGDDEEPLQQPSSKQTARYLQLFEKAIREIQSPCLPLFAPVESLQPRKVEGYCTGAFEDALHLALKLDINCELFSSSSLSHSGVHVSKLLLWYFSFGQCLGIAWRSNILLPLQYVSNDFWNELVTPTVDLNEQGNKNDSTVRVMAIRAIRDGLFSIIPSRCVALLRNNPSLRQRLSDLDVSYITRLEHHAIHPTPRQNRHDMFWRVVGAFTSLERRLLEQFINPERRNGPKATALGPNTPAVFVLEIADALADGRDHPDSCYPVVVQISPSSSRLHLPAYSSAQTLRQKLLLAMTNIPFM